MSEWKQVWQLTKIECKKYTLWYVSSFLIAVLLALILGESFPTYMSQHKFFYEQNPGIYDIVFIALFVLLPSLNRPKDFRYQEIKGQLWGSPYFIKLLQLAIPEKVVIKSRFLVYFIQSVPFHILFLSLFYFISGLKGDAMPLLTFVSFSIIWLSFGIYGGFLYPASDAGDQISKLKMFFIAIVYAGIVLGLFKFIEYASPYGLVKWTYVLATKWPVTSAFISIMMAGAGVYFWMNHMKKTMRKMDYL